ncbi:MAG TPA: DEAD/DEAH box helicase [Chitinophagaceae bacterium]|nr:DEAD/DEAH box helicase [Chitinophagaceae bacterium]
MNTFETLGLSMPIVKAITEKGFTSPTPIQEKVIPSVLSNHTDIVALAQTGTGKTAAFGLPLLTLLDLTSTQTQALILCPTRELCMQITKDLQQFATYLPKINIVAVYGGTSIQTQLTAIRRGAQIIVATPGRMIDIINRKKVNLSTIKYAILDEADEMLNMGFKEDLDTILSETPAEKNTWLFSATMPNEVLRIARTYMHKPIEISAGVKNQGNENIEHIFYIVNDKDRYVALKRIADYNPDIFAIVFCRTKAETQHVASALIKDGYNADSLHGDLSQAQRDMVMKRYRSRSLQMLVATDVAARGIDVNDVTHVINYNLPDEAENYTHRSGRTARAGKTGVSIALINKKEQYRISAIERIIKNKFVKQPVPTGFEVCEKQLKHLVQRLSNTAINETDLQPYLPSLMAELTSLSKEEIVKKWLTLEFNRFIEYYKNAPDLNNSTTEKISYQGRSTSGKRLFINIGEMDGFNTSSLRQYICATANMDNEELLWIDVKNNYSFIDVSLSALDQLLQSFTRQVYKGRRVRIERSEGKESSSRGGEGRAAARSTTGRTRTYSSKPKRYQKS